MHAKKWNLAHLQLNKTFLFVDDDFATCTAAKRMASLYGVSVQTASSAKSALTLLEHNPRDYFLILTDEIMPGMSGTELLVIVKERWPYIRRALVSGSEDPGIVRKAEEDAKTCRYLSKPILDVELRDLVEHACEDFLSRQESLELVIADRINLIVETLKNKLAYDVYSLFSTFPKDYLALCERGWTQTKRYHNRVSIQDSEHFHGFLARRVEVAIERVAGRDYSTSANSGLRLSSLLRQFGVKCLRKYDRFIDRDESILVAMCSTMRDYYSILGFEMSEMVSAQERYINISLGSRFVYNDFFNPLLSSVERGAELACLKLEFFMLAHLVNIPVEMNFSRQFSVRIIL